MGATARTIREPLKIKEWGKPKTEEARQKIEELKAQVEASRPQESVFQKNWKGLKSGKKILGMPRMVAIPVGVVLLAGIGFGIFKLIKSRK